MLLPFWNLFQDVGGGPPPVLFDSLGRTDVTVVGSVRFCQPIGSNREAAAQGSRRTVEMA